ncbi:hypothetical protein V6N13_018877 [Hibiscus sabdariffa]
MDSFKNDDSFSVSGNFHLVSMFIFERIPWVVSRLLNPRAPKTLPEFIEGDNALPTEFPLMVKWHKKMDRSLKDTRNVLNMRTFTQIFNWLSEDDASESYDLYTPKFQKKTTLYDPGALIKGRPKNYYPFRDQKKELKAHHQDIPGISPTHVQEDVGVDEQYTDSGTLPTPDQVDDIPGTPIQEQNDVEYGGLQQNNAEDISGTLPTQEEDVRDDEQQDHASALPQEHDHAGALTQRLRELLTYRRKRRKHAMGQLPRKHRAREDKLEIKKMIIYGVKHAVNELYKLKSIPNPENGEKLTDEAYEDPNKYLQSLTPPKRKLVIWDVNGVLANISFQRKKVVTMRPGVSQFIQFCLNNFVVAIWSSKLSGNINPTLDKLQDLTEQFKFIWKYSYICPDTFDASSLNDNVLEKGGIIWEYLNDLSKADNVQYYVKNNPFSG